MEEQQMTLEGTENQGPTMFLKVITILTFIACAWGLFQSINFYFNSDKQMIEMEKRISDLEDKGVSGMWLQMAYDGEASMRIRIENGTLFLILDILGLALCAYGAWSMRKLQKTGYYAWLAGEFLPIISAFIIIGSLMLKPLTLIFLLTIPVAFTIMYGTQLKHMK